METTTTPDTIQSMATRVKRGAKLLDKKVPGWRKVMREHQRDFYLSTPECCILGTLEHYHGRMKTLRSRNANVKGHIARDECSYAIALARLGIHGEGDEFGFDHGDMDAAGYELLEALWKAEFEDGK